MRVCFVMAGLPHYFTLILNKMVSETGTEVVLIKPSHKSKALGSGVKEDTSSVKFRLIELPEYTAWYGKPFFKDLVPTLAEIKPDIIVMSAWPYFLQLVLNPFFYSKLRGLGAKLICRDIPFNISYWGKSREYYFSGQNITEDLDRSGGKSWGGYLFFYILTILRRLYLPLADAHINYFDEARNITGSYGVPDEKIFIAANSPDTDLLLATYEEVLKQPLLLPINNYRLIHVGRLVKWKRVDMLIRCVKDLAHVFPDIELVVIGFGPEEEALKKLAQNEGVGLKVNFVGGVYDSLTLGRYLHASSVYVLGGMGGLSINDAMCFGKPVICSVADGTEKRLVREGYNGYYFDNGDQESLNTAVKNLLSDPKKIERFGIHSLKIIQDEVNIHSVLREYDAAFKYVMAH
ncbi:D-inositol-3-phosphate glycosyltransferase [Dyadobacter sp. CECT 9275]|uniref:D-inositol-3-phosphate glycosyltransferase n=1 Tax=Dyadobacter helix TaxID=2822344 RepID=A0A916JC93_9BACT|nr:glycosyltransferase family 4 protein [Dyadobacter sp. CECT 9275]CAG4991433.1 D-inositol-3-phosphate glycosyltransferase [Dyadobacter sp. CECT 9275]